MLKIVPLFLITTTTTTATTFQSAQCRIIDKLDFLLKCVVSPHGMAICQSEYFFIDWPKEPSPAFVTFWDVWCLKSFISNALKSVCLFQKKVRCTQKKIRGPAWNNTEYP
ncbi:hypothetical protein BDB00DRAFT_860633 [Zychaea mexicana]|uniref:uncharacterized protein n=1 Tax=Zychaea mexicana TaxID=64656 RepID=UPI0022FDEAFE|nr:uncharacterized protein BDB00DRAFT_860633 [Zychaea mexicana]KAI9474327.1 hypothetical protein BDB00DRAFT_860633 [Zychaea mexicana]